VSERTKITLDESEIPRQWYNVIPDLPAPPPPPLHPGTLQPVGPEDLAPLFPMELIRQEVDQASREHAMHQLAQGRVLIGRPQVTI